MFGRRQVTTLLVSVIFSLSLIGAGCGEAADAPGPTLTPAGATLPAATQPAPPPDPTVTVTILPSVDSSNVFVETAVVTEENGRFQLTITGSLPDGCTDIVAVQQEFVPEANRFDVAFTTSRPQDTLCTEALVSFERTVVLETADLAPGAFTVNVAGATTRFTIEQ